MRHGTEVPRDHQGEPGRDHEVHHQGPDDKVAPVSSLAASALILASLVLSCGCSTPSRHGTIILYSRPASRVAASPYRMVLTTDPASPHLRPKELRPEKPEDRLRNLLEEKGDKLPEADAESRYKEVTKGLPVETVVFIHPEDLGRLITDLEEIGLFQLPVHDGAPPLGRAYILWDDGTEVRTYLRAPRDSQLADFATFTRAAGHILRAASR